MNHIVSYELCKDCEWFKFKKGKIMNMLANDICNRRQLVGCPNKKIGGE